jgi:4-hydroxybenzoate polyprenyltransferase
MFDKGTLVILLVVIIPSLITNCYLYWKNRHNGQRPRKYFWGIVINVILGILILLANYYNL